MQAGGSCAMDVDEEWIRFLLDPDEPLPNPNNLGMVLPLVLPVVTPAPTRRVHFDYAAVPFAMGEHETPEQHQPGVEPPPPPPNPPRLQQPPPPQQRPPLQQRPFTFEPLHPTPQGAQGATPQSAAGGCPRCRGQHRPHTCGRARTNLAAPAPMLSPFPSAVAVALWRNIAIL